jgi:hypothetical protein
MNEAGRVAMMEEQLLDLERTEEALVERALAQGAGRVPQAARRPSCRARRQAGNEGRRQGGVTSPSCGEEEERRRRNWPPPQDPVYAAS